MSLFEKELTGKFLVVHQSDGEWGVGTIESVHESGTMLLRYQCTHCADVMNTRLINPANPLYDDLLVFADRAEYDAWYASLGDEGEEAESKFGSHLHWDAVKVQGA